MPARFAGKYTVGFKLARTLVSRVGSFIVPPRGFPCLDVFLSQRDIRAHRTASPTPVQTQAFHLALVLFKQALKNKKQRPGQNRNCTQCGFPGDRLAQKERR